MEENITEQIQRLFPLVGQLRSVTGNRVCTYCINHVLVRGYDDVGRVPHRGNAAAYVRIDNHGHQYRYRVHLHHFT